MRTKHNAANQGEQNYHKRKDKERFLHPAGRRFMSTHLYIKQMLLTSLARCGKSSILFARFSLAGHLLLDTLLSREI